MKSKVDVYSNRAVAQFDMSAANTLTFEEIQFSRSVFDHTALILNRIEYVPSHGSLLELDADTDYIHIGCMRSNNVSSFTWNDDRIIDAAFWMSHVVGTAASLWIHHTPLTKDFSTMPGGGLLVPAYPFYVAMLTAGFAAAGSCEVRIYYQYRKLSGAQWLELVESMRVAE